jgi:hypothetical protein
MHKNKPPESFAEPREGNQIINQKDISTMKLSITIDTTDLIDAIAERYPHAGLTEAEIQTILENSFRDRLTYDKDYEWHLDHDPCFKVISTNKVTNGL